MNLKGTQTEKNLWNAFAGESQARNKYISFGKKAVEEGYPDIADIFLDTTQQEEDHALDLLNFLSGTHDTLTNLRHAAEGEHYETATLYKEYERVAREEGFEAIAEYLKNLRIIEAEHEKRYLGLMQQLKKQLKK
ncbi:rubrerythrin family protein [Alkaliphilus hydrothermalis]|uniref:Rubrerythrin n=1 Tax=Alkaliphilus hydrothermalis TaxID=1482730 RepID=A0ABS2NQE7_9FIRM|nr:rubrerythrin family protein [Alkaliphilus hydrothermalis]MBM7615160.1 rubrerythrin [Alkaliphilus hydrothermalis]